MGNLDKDTERRHYLNEPFTARYVRLNPKHWHQAVALRAALLGCPHRGDCGPRFFRVHEEAPCGGWGDWANSWSLKFVLFPNKLAF